MTEAGREWLHWAAFQVLLVPKFQNFIALYSPSFIEYKALLPLEVIIFANFLDSSSQTISHQFHNRFIT